MIFHTGDVLCNCIKIQYYTSAFCYFFMYYNHQQDTQDADKLILPALDKILTLGRINKLILLSLNRIFRGDGREVRNE